MFPIWKRLISTKRPKKAVKSVHGVRALSMMWVMIYHLWSQVMRHGGDRRFAVDNLKNGEWSFVTNGTISVR